MTEFSCQFERMTLPHALEIANEWRYPEPFDFYNADADLEDYEEFISPNRWPAVFEACFHNEELVGFFSANVEDLVAELGVGLRPDLTGWGRGRGFIESSLSRLLELEPHLEQVTLMVAEFNERAIRTYKRCGFEVTGTHKQETNGGEYQFVDMRLPLR